jgi:predicted esterase
MKSSLLIALLSIASMSFGQTITTKFDCENYGTTTPWSPLWNFTDISQRMFSNVNFGNGFFHGYLEHLPASYNKPENASKTYPVIIFFHGYASRGDGSPLNLCRLFKDMGGDLATHLSIPGRIERQPALFTQNDGVTNREFIVISPQFNEYTRLQEGKTDHFPSANEVDLVIDYVEDHYRIDSRRIYLTGLSNGANMITEYAASSLARAKRVAAIMPISLCSQRTHVNNTSRGIDAKYIGQAKLKTWFVYCEGDNCGFGPALKVPLDWVNAINAVPGAIAPRYTMLYKRTASQSPSLYSCSDTLWHDAWSRAYNPDFKAVYNTANSTYQSTPQNIYTWFAASTNAVLPVVMKDYIARFNNGDVEISWVTTDEKNNASFTIERAGEDQHFTPIGTIPGLGDHTGEQPYSFIDKNPLSGINLYRLVQTDIDGEKTYFEIKKILNKPGGGPAIMVSPNPFVNTISAFISLDRSQKIGITVTDMTGKVLKSSNAVFGPGNAEIKLNASDLPAGMYFLRVHGENLTFTSKVVKN